VGGVGALIKRKKPRKKRHQKKRCMKRKTASDEGGDMNTFSKGHGGGEKKVRSKGEKDSSQKIEKGRINVWVKKFILTFIQE